MENLKEYIARTRAGRRPATRRPERDDADAIGVTNSNGFHTASAFFLANTAPKERDARMRAFQHKLTDFEDRDMVVVALAVSAVVEAS